MWREAGYAQPLLPLHERAAAGCLGCALLPSIEHCCWPTCCSSAWLPFGSHLAPEFWVLLAARMFTLAIHPPTPTFCAPTASMPLPHTIHLSICNQPASFCPAVPQVALENKEAINDEFFSTVKAVLQSQAVSWRVSMYVARQHWVRWAHVAAAAAECSWAARSWAHLPGWLVNLSGCCRPSNHSLLLAVQGCHQRSLGRQHD